MITSSIFSLHPQEIRALFAACEQEETDTLKIREKALLSVLIDTGARASELCFDPKRPQEKTGLRMEDIFLSPGDSYILVYGKGNKRREIGLGDRSRSALRRYITRYRTPSKANPYAFVSDRGGIPLTVGGMEIWLARIAERAHLEDAYLHKFRHTFAVNYLLNGGDLYRLMRLMGHTDVKITQVYLRAIDQKQARVGISVLDTMSK